MRVAKIAFASPELIQAFRNLQGQPGKKFYVTMSAGNDAGNAKSNLPGCFNGPRFFTISSINGDLTCADYANFNLESPGAKQVDYVTVSTRVFSLWKDNQFRMASGTSASSALAAGIVCALGEHGNNLLTKHALFLNILLFLTSYAFLLFKIGDKPNTLLKSRQQN